MAKHVQIAFDFDAAKTPEPAAPAEQALPTPAQEKTNISENAGATATGTTAPAKTRRGRKSLRQMEEEAKFIELPPDEVLQLKLYHSITEVCQMLQLNPSTLRYWETEFRQLKPRKNGKGDRFYTFADIKLLHLIYFLLRQRKYTIEGAKEYLNKYKNEATQRFELVQGLQRLKNFLLALQADL
ncbi:MAG: MerR family transcriptional regulator [Lacibacter sp.]